MQTDSVIPYLFLPVSVKCKPYFFKKFDPEFEFGIEFSIILEKKEWQASFFLITNQVLTDENHIYYKQLVNFITEPRLIRTLSKKKVFIQNRGFISSDFSTGEGVIFSVEKIEKDFTLEAYIVFEARFFELMYEIFDVEEKNLEKLEKKIYYLLSTPSNDFSEYILKLPDNKIQLILNHILHKKIASVDMLASYIRNLGKDGERLVENLSSRVKAELKEKIKSGRIFSTYRWAEEVSYIINRNLLIASRELEISLPFFERMEFIRKSYEIAILRKEIAQKPLISWLIEFDLEKLNKLLSSVPRNTLARALTFVNQKEIEQIFSKVMSKNGIKLLLEDVLYSFNQSEEERFYALLKTMRSVKEIYYTPVVEKLDFQETVERYLSSPETLDLIVNEIGFAKVIFSLKGLREEYLEKILTGTLKKIFEDFTKNKIIIKEHFDSRIRDYRKEFLKVLLILRDEGKV